MTNRTTQALAQRLNSFIHIFFIWGSILITGCTSHIKSADGAYNIELNDEYNQKDFATTLRVNGILFSDGHFIPSSKSEQEMKKIIRKNDLSPTSSAVRGFATPEYFEFRFNYTPTKRCFVFTNAVLPSMSAQ